MTITKLKRTARSIFTLNRDREFRTLCQMLDLQPNDVLLDIGSGDGYWTKCLGQHCDTVVGLEPDNKLRGYAESFFSHRNVTYLAGTAEEIPYPDSYFTKIISVSCFEHFADQEASMCEIRRVLKPGGTVALSVDSLLPENSPQDFRDWHRHKHHVNRYFTVKELKKMFERCELTYIPQTTTTLFHSRTAGYLRKVFTQNTKLLIPLFPFFYFGARVSDALFHDQPGQITIVCAKG